jgi:thioredoxin 1
MNLLEEKVAASPLVLVDFYADWCEPCKWVEPVLKELHDHYGSRLVLEKINIDSHPEIAAGLHVLSVPTLILFSGGAEKWRKRGFDTAPKMIAEIESVIED